LSLHVRSMQKGGTFSKLTLVPHSHAFYDLIVCADLYKKKRIKISMSETEKETETEKQSDRVPI